MLSLKIYFQILKYAFLHSFSQKEPPFQKLTLLSLIQIIIYNFFLSLSIILSLQWMLFQFAWSENNTGTLLILFSILTGIHFIIIVIDWLSKENNKDTPFVILGHILSAIIHGIMVTVFGTSGLFYSAALGIITVFLWNLKPDVDELKGFSSVLFLLIGYCLQALLGAIGFGATFLAIFQFPFYPFLYFQKVYSPYYPLQWNQNILLPLWFLPEKIQREAKINKVKTVELLSKLLVTPFLYKKITEKAFVYLIIDTILEIQTFREIEHKNEKLQELKYSVDDIPKEFMDYLSELDRLFLGLFLPTESNGVRYYYSQDTREMQDKQMKELPKQLESFKERLLQKSSFSAKQFIKIIDHWQILLKEYLNNR